MVYGDLKIQVHYAYNRYRLAKRFFTDKLTILLYSLVSLLKLKLEPTFR